MRWISSALTTCSSANLSPAFLIQVYILSSSPFMSFSILSSLKINSSLLPPTTAPKLAPLLPASWSQWNQHLPNCQSQKIESYPWHEPLLHSHMQSPKSWPLPPKTLSNWFFSPKMPSFLPKLLQQLPTGLPTSTLPTLEYILCISLSGLPKAIRLGAYSTLTI